MLEGEIWYKISCPSCKCYNFVYGGYFPDPNMSKLDVDGFRCWQCKKEHMFFDDPDLDGLGIIEDGIKEISYTK